jgi:hypothetical protein
MNNTPFSPTPDLVAQLCGGGQPVSGTVKPTYAATIAIESFLGYTRFLEIVSTAAIGNASITTAFLGLPGNRLVIQLTNDATSGRTTTFSTGFRATGTVVNTTSKIFLVEFVSDGKTWNEVARSASAIT